MSGGNVPALHFLTTAWASELTLGSRDGNQEQAFELRYLHGTAGDFGGVTARYRHTWSWATPAGLLGVYTGWRGDMYS